MQLRFKLVALREQHTPPNSEHLEMGGEVIRVDFAEIAGVAVGFAIRNKSATPTRQADELSKRSWIDDLAFGAVCN